MDSPIIPTIDAAMLKAIEVAEQIWGDDEFKREFAKTVRDVFRQEITTLKSALQAEHTSRRIAVEETSNAIRMALDDLLGNDGEDFAAQVPRKAFWKIVGPWFERIAS